jgi:hypothetical protein
MTRPGLSVAHRRPGLLISALLGVSAALLVSCGASSNKLIPVANSEPLQKDFEEVARAAEAGHGSCTATEATIAKAESDFQALPASIDNGLRNRLHEGITKLHNDALELCAQPPTSTTSSVTAPTTTTPTTTTPTTTVPTTTTPTTATTPTTGTTAPGGGTPAKEGEVEGEEGKPKDKGKGSEGGGAGGTGAGEGGK